MAKLLTAFALYFHTCALKYFTLLAQPTCRLLRPNKPPESPIHFSSSDFSPNENEPINDSITGVQSRRTLGIFLTRNRSRETKLRRGLHSALLIDVNKVAILDANLQVILDFRCAYSLIWTIHSRCTIRVSTDVRKRKYLRGFTNYLELQWNARKK